MDVYWLDQTASNVPADSDWLSARETGFMHGLRIPKRLADWRLGRWTAKRAVTLWLGMPICPRVLAKIEIRAAPTGAPEVFVADQPGDMAISLSHRGGKALCAIAPSAVELGCDREMIEPHSNAFISDFFTLEEQALIKQASAADRLRLIALLWSAKESALKALQTGLRLDTRDVTVTLRRSFDLCGWSSLQVRCTDGRVFEGWWQQEDCAIRTLIADPPTGAPIRFEDPAGVSDRVAQCA